MSGGLLVVTAHPDDEVLIAGGTLAACAEAGFPTAVVCLTRGEDGPIADPELATRTTLPDVRVAELHAACAELGVGWVKCFRGEDGNLQWSDRATLVHELARVIDDRRPHAVISFGEDGLYWHPDHIAAFRFTREAIERAADPPALYRAVWPAELSVSLERELLERSLPADLWDISASGFGVGPDERAGEIVINVCSHALRKLKALRCHRSQLGPTHAFTVMPDELAGRFLGWERFVPMTSANNRGWLELTLRASARA